MPNRDFLLWEKHSRNRYIFLWKYLLPMEHSKCAILNVKQLTAESIYKIYWCLMKNLHENYEHSINLMALFHVLFIRFGKSKQHFEVWVANLSFRFGKLSHNQNTWDLESFNAILSFSIFWMMEKIDSINVRRLKLDLHFQTKN